MQLDAFEDVAALIKFSPATIANWAYRRRPAPAGFPEPVKIGRQLRYLRKEVEAWIAWRADTRPSQPEQPDAVAAARCGDPDVLGMKTEPGRPKNKIGGA